MARDEKTRNQRVDRRTYLQLAGTGVFSATAIGATSDEVGAVKPDEYGTYGFGTGSYGGNSAESALSVSITDATNVTHSQAVLHGSLSDLGGASSATVRFDYRVVGDSNWSATSTRSRTTTGTYQTTITDLESGTEYEFRSVATSSDGDTATSSVLTFTTSMNTIVIDGSASSGTTNEYTFTVSGDVEKSSALGSIQDNDSISGSTVDGEVVGGKDGYRYTGEITDFAVDGDVTIYRNGTEVTPSDLGDATLPNWFVVDGSGAPNEKSTYTISVSGELEKSSRLGSIQANDSISGSTVSGQVVGGKDAYRYSGEVTRVEIAGPAVIRINDTDGT